MSVFCKIMLATVFERISQLSSRRWWLSQRRRYLEFMILLTIVRVWFRRQSCISPSDSNLHREVPPPPPPPCPQTTGDPDVRFAPPADHGVRRHRESGDESTSGVDGVDDEDEDTAPFNGACSSLSCRRISSVATPPHPPLSLEPSAEILPASSSTPSFGASTVDSLSTSILNDQTALSTALSTIKTASECSTGDDGRLPAHSYTRSVIIDALNCHRQFRNVKQQRLNQLKQQ